eukprot:1182217-Prorocentrum_minimum.AAC.3
MFDSRSRMFDSRSIKFDSRSRMFFLVQNVRQPDLQGFVSGNHRLQRRPVRGTRNPKSDRNIVTRLLSPDCCHRIVVSG